MIQFGLPLTRFSPFPDWYLQERSLPHPRPAPFDGIEDEGPISVHPGLPTDVPLLIVYRGFRQETIPPLSDWGWYRTLPRDLGRERFKTEVGEFWCLP